MKTNTRYWIYLQSCFVNLLSKLVHRNVRWSTDQHLSVVLFDQVVHDGSRCHSLTSSRRTLKEQNNSVKIHSHFLQRRCELMTVWQWYLNETEWSLEDRLDSIHLGVVQLWEVRDTESLGKLTFDDNILHLMSQKFVVDVSPYRCFIHSEGLQGCLHPVKWFMIIWLNTKTQHEAHAWEMNSK